MQRKASGGRDGGRSLPLPPRHHRAVAVSMREARAARIPAPLAAAGVIVGATLVFLYAPLITLMVFSFNNSRATSSGRASRSTTTRRR